MKPKCISSTVSAFLVAVFIFFCGAMPAKAMEFVLIPSGTFTMGSPEGEAGHPTDETQHQVRVSEFYMSKYEVTVAEFRKFVAATGYRTDAEKGGGSYIFDGTNYVNTAGVNWRHGISGNVRPQSEENHPVVHVSWNDAVAYCKALSAKRGKVYRLPTEAEWEYACRAGSRTPFSTGENLPTNQANYDGNYPYNGNPTGVYRQNTVAVNRFAPNAWGLYNMHGNVWEWCSDRYDPSYYDECKANHTVINPAGSSTGSTRVLRGGSWYNLAETCRSAYRRGSTPGSRTYDLGFRLVFVP
jgi:formylglycine-generating enzyme